MTLGSVEIGFRVVVKHFHFVIGRLLQVDGVLQVRPRRVHRRLILIMRTGWVWASRRRASKRCKWLLLHFLFLLLEDDGFRLLLVLRHSFIEEFVIVAVITFVVIAIVVSFILLLLLFSTGWVS